MLADIACACDPASRNPRSAIANPQSIEPRVFLNGRISISSQREAEIAHRYFALGGVVGGLVATIAVCCLAAAFKRSEDN